AARGEEVAAFEGGDARRKRRYSRPTPPCRPGGIAKMRRTLIRHATVVSMDPSVGDLPDADILIEDAKIAAIRPGIAAADAEEIDGRNRIAIPGFIDTHRHTWQCLLRNAAADWSLPQYFAGVRGVMGGLYTADDMLVANRLGALEALNAGITTLYDWSHN